LKQLVNYNGDLVHIDALNLLAKNRMFCYGDGLFETIKIANAKPQFIDLHFKRLQKGLDLLGIKMPFKRSELDEHIRRLIYGNKVLFGGRLRLSVFRGIGGLYKPDTDEAGFVLTLDKTEHNEYVEQKAVLLGVYKDLKKPMNFLSNLKNPYAVFSVLAAKKITHHFDDNILLNALNNVCETTHSNIFVYKDGCVLTPPLSQGCVEGVMRQILLTKIFKQLNIAFKEQIISLDVLLEAQEIFLSNVISGVRSVKGINEKRYYHTFSKKIIQSINTLLK